MTIAVVAEVQVTGTNGGTSASRDSRGSDKIVINVAEYSPGSPITPSDNQGNTYTALTMKSDGANGEVRLWYCDNPTTSASHTWTLGATTSASACQVICLSGTATGSAYIDTGSDKQAFVGTGTSMNTGSFTPSANGSIVLTGFVSGGAGTANPSCSGFTLSNRASYNSGVNITGALYYQIQTTATAVNPSWSWTTSSAAASVEVTILAAGAAGVVLTEPAALASQTLPPSLAVSGTYVGSPSGLEFQLTAHSGGAVVQAWTAITGATIAGGNWSGTAVMTPTATYCDMQIRHSNDHSIVSSLSTRQFNVGPAVFLIGQSQLAHLWENSSTLTDVVTNGSTTITSAYVNANFATNRMAGYAAAGTDITGGTTVVSHSAGNIVLSQAAANGGSGRTVTLGPACPTATAGTTRFQNIAFYPTSDGPHASESDFSQTLASAEGAVALGNEMAAAFSGGSTQLQAAVGSTTSKYWTSPSGAGYTSASTMLTTAGGNKISDARWDDGGTDAINCTQAVTGTANNGSGLIRITVPDTYLHTTGDTIVVSGIAAGTTEANGTWVVTVVDSTHLDLQGSTFSNAFVSGGSSVITIGAGKWTTNTTNVEAWVRAVAPIAGFAVNIIGSDLGGSIPDNSTDLIRQQQLAYVDNNASGYVYFAGHDLDLQRQDSFHLSPPSRLRVAKRAAQAHARYHGLSSSGYGGKITSVTWNGGTKVTATVTHEAGTALTSKNLSSSGASLTGAKIFNSGSQLTISSTAFVQPNKIEYTLSSTPANVTHFSYLAGSNPTVTNLIYDDQAPLSDTDGLPIQPTRGTNGKMAVTLVASTGIPLDVLSFGVAA